MPFYVKQGKIPPKRHTTFYRDDGELYREELFSTHGFSNIYSNKYHYNMPTKALSVERYGLSHGSEWSDALRQNYKFDAFKLDQGGNFFSARMKSLYNNDVAISTAKVTEPTELYYRNAYADEVLFIHQGSGIMRSEYGEIKIQQWDYVIIPRGSIYQLEFDNYDDIRLLVVESYSMVNIPKHYRNEYGQLLETAPYCERDIRTPELAEATVLQGKFQLVNKFGDHYQIHSLEWHPFDVVGWDGYCYPWAINIKEFAPLVGEIHLPPSVHLLLSGDNFVLCNFVPRPFDFHPDSIPAPYYHSNIDSDEVLYYVEGNFMSRKGIGPGYMTLHPKGVPHGPQPGKTEESIGKTHTNEYAIMVDTFKPLKLSEHVKSTMDDNYNASWLE